MEANKREIFYARKLENYKRTNKCLRVEPIGVELEEKFIEINGDSSSETFIYPEIRNHLSFWKLSRETFAFLLFRFFLEKEIFIIQTKAKLNRI